MTKRITKMTFVMHNFMDGDDVKRAHELNLRGEWSSDSKLLEVQERLKACSYTFAHPDTNRLVPACVQHSVLDPQINERLKQEFPVRQKGNDCCSNKNLEW